MVASELPPLDLLADELAVCRLPVDAAIPNWVWAGELTSVTATDDELSLVCAASAVPDGVTHSPGWRALKVRGPLDFDLVGVIAGLSSTLADARIPIFVLSTHDTDYVLVQEPRLEDAVTALRRAGYGIGRSSD